MSAFTASAAAEVASAWPEGRVYQPGKVPANPTTPYIVMYGDAGRDDVPMLDATAGTKAHRHGPMAVGRTEGEVERATNAIEAGLAGRRIYAGQRQSTPIWVESTSLVVRDPDGGALLTQTTFLTFNSYPKD